MKEYFQKYDAFGKFFVVISAILEIIGIVLWDWKMFFGFSAISMILEYVSIQYCTTPEYFQKHFADKIHKPSRNLFAIFFSITMIIISCYCFGVLPKTRAIYAACASLLASSVACVLNEYCINGNKKTKGLVACALVTIIIGFIIYLNAAGFFGI